MQLIHEKKIWMLDRWLVKQKCHISVCQSFMIAVDSETLTTSRCLYVCQRRWKTGVWDNWSYRWVHISSKQAFFPLQAYGIEVLSWTESSIRTMEKRNQLCKSLSLANKSFLHKHSFTHLSKPALAYFQVCFACNQLSLTSAFYSLFHSVSYLF